MKPGFTAIPNDLFEVLLCFRCPKGYKELIFAIIRLTEGYHMTERPVSISYLSRFLKQDKSNVAKRLNRLIEGNVIEEVKKPGFTDARHIKINRNYKEWTVTEVRNTKSKRYNAGAGGSVQAEAAFAGEKATVAETTTPPVVKSATNKNTSFNNLKMKVADIVGLKKGDDAGNLQQTAIKEPETFAEPELTEFLMRLYERSFRRKPNIDELFEFRKQILSDDRFDKKENVKILRKAFHKAAISDESKKNTVYILGIIRSMKLDILKKRNSIAADATFDVFRLRRGQQEEI